MIFEKESESNLYTMILFTIHKINCMPISKCDQAFNIYYFINDVKRKHSDVFGVIDIY